VVKKIISFGAIAPHIYTCARVQCRRDPKTLGLWKTPSVYNIYVRVFLGGGWIGAGGRRTRVGVYTKPYSHDYRTN